MSYFDDNEDYIIYGGRRYRKHPHGPRAVTCQRCGEAGLEWFHTGTRWRLMGADGKFHVCKNDNAVDDFEVLTE